MPTALISGALANKPFNGGNAWTRLSWVVGLQKLGWNVCFVEQIGSENCVQANGAATVFENSTNLAYFQTTMERFGLSENSSLICDQGQKMHGLSLKDLEQKVRQSDFLFNFSGHLTQPELMGQAKFKIYFDDDPGFTQFWHAAGNPGPRLVGHDAYFTVGANIGSGHCSIPTNDISWRVTRPPVVLSDWPAREPAVFERFTSVASWRGAYAPIQYGGKTYGLKVHEFRKFIELPVRTDAKFELALDINPADKKDIDALFAHGWRLVDPKQTCGSADAFRNYVAGSSAEFSAAQGVYVDTQSGWFSDRTVRYLASGRPALVQDTGFSRIFPVGEGLLAFRDLDQAVAGARAIERDYRRHCRAARLIAEEYFDSDKVIGEMLETVGLGMPATR